MIQFANIAIDAIQSAKTNFVKTFVTNEELKKPLQTYIDAQAAFLKKVAQETNTFFTTLGTAAYNFDAAKAFTVK
jgi:hypothetical protein